MGSGAAWRCVNDEQAASFFRAHKREFLGCAGDERRVIAALALLSPDGNKVIIDVPAHVETILARARHALGIGHWALGIGTLALRTGWAHCVKSAAWFRGRARVPRVES